MKRLSIIALFLPAVLSCVKDLAGERIQPGESLPAFSVTTLDGKTVSTSDLLGKPSAVILFSTTCPDCHRQLPELQDVFDDGLNQYNILAIAREETAGTVSDHWKENGYTMPAAAPGDRRVYDLFDRGSRSGVPLLYLSDAAGKVRAVADDKATLYRDDIRNILSEMTVEFVTSKNSHEK